MAQSTDESEKPAKKDKYAKFWRTQKLAEPIRRQKKYDYPIYQYKCIVSPSTLTADCSARNNDFAQPTIRHLKQNKKSYEFLGPFYAKTMDKKIAESWATIYHYYDRLMADLEKTEKPKKKGKRDSKLCLKNFRSGMSTSQKMVLFKQWSENKTLPKPVFPPEPIDRGKIVDLDSIKGHISSMATPNPLPPGYLPPRQFPIDIPRNALYGEVPSRSLALYYGIKEKPVIPAKSLAVSHAALKYIASERIKEISVPKTKREKRDLDIKENPFAISPAALKYKATERILQLAKPLERD